MALIDLSKYDILDLLFTKGMTDDERGAYIYDYMEAFAGYLAEKVGDQFTDEDELKLEELMTKPDATPEMIENFYKTKIPNYDSFLLGATLMFKKSFLLEFYKTMLEETTKAQDPSIGYWVRIVAAAEDDNWDLVYNLIMEASDKFLKDIPPQTQPITAN